MYICTCTYIHKYIHVYIYTCIFNYRADIINKKVTDLKSTATG